MGTLSLWLLSISLITPEKWPQNLGYQLIEFRQYSTNKSKVQGRYPPPLCHQCEAQNPKVEDSTWIAQSFCSASKACFLPRNFFLTKGRFTCICNSAILGQTNEQYFNFKILPQSSKGGFLPGISSTISVTAFPSLLPAYLWRLAEPSCFRDAISQGILIMGIFFPEQIFYYCVFFVCLSYVQLISLCF